MDCRLQFLLSVFDSMAHYTNTLQVQVKFTNYITTAAIWTQTHACFVIDNKLNMIMNPHLQYNDNLRTAEEACVAFPNHFVRYIKSVYVY